MMEPTTHFFLRHFKAIQKRELRKFIAFGIIGGIGAILNTFVLFFLTEYFSIHYIIASVIATELAIISNFLGNTFFTFRNEDSSKQYLSNFFRFQFISISTIAGTTFLLWIMTNTFGLDKIILWNLIAITIMFLCNFYLNRKFTWRRNKDGKKSSPRRIQTTDPLNNKRSLKMKIIISFLAVLFFLPLVEADQLTAVSQMGYHPQSAKYVIVYTPEQTGTFEIIDAESQNSVFTGTLVKAIDYDGNVVECQGNNPCLQGDFTNFTTEGNYFIRSITASETVVSPEFIIDNSIFKNNLGLFQEFFKAMQQQNSPYHADFHKEYAPSLPVIADGSFIMKADQAALTLIRLGSAYRRNPQLFDETWRHHLKTYADYLQELQGLSITERTDGTGFRLNPAVEIIDAFIPGSTNQTEIAVYIPGNPPQLIRTVPLRSLCGNLSSSEYNTCVNNAEQYYKCQINEPCLNLQYIERTGVLQSSGNNYAVSGGWAYEFGCFIDVAVTEPLFNGKYNPCLIFDSEATSLYTVMTLLAFLEAYPAVLDLSVQESQQLMQKAIDTEHFIENEYASLSSAEIGFYGAALFLLYDYTGNEDYLRKAHAIRTEVPITFIADSTRGNEFYWEEYIRHKHSLEQIDLVYEIAGTNPRDYFQGKIFFDYKDRGPTAISRNAERVFQFDPNIQFQNSRFMLTEGILAYKTLELHPHAEDFVQEVADNQLAWLTGMNGVQRGVSLGAPIVSQSFIFGIGNFPTEFHSRYLVNTGHNQQSNGEISGARGTSLQFFDEVANEYVYFDGVTTILGSTLGALGNGWQGEEQIDPFQVNNTFLNGLGYIPGWINGAFDVNTNSQETDTIFNYDDNVKTYEFTETTNEIVATAVEVFSYADALYNNKSSYSLGLNSSLPTIPLGNSSNTSNNNFNSTFNSTISPLNNSLNPSSNSTGNNSNLTNHNSTNNNVTNQTFNNASTALINITTNPAESDVYLNTTFYGPTDENGTLILTNITAGDYLLTIAKVGFVNDTRVIQVISNETLTINANLSRDQENSSSEEGNNNHFTENRGDDDSSSRSGSSGGNSGGHASDPEIVYALFSHDVVAVNGTQELKLDAKYFGGGISNITAIIVTPLQGERKIKLERVGGSKEYGTWSAQFTDFREGLHALQFIEVKSKSKTWKTPLKNVHFYATSEHNEGNLALVNIFLDKNQIEFAKNITLTLDARDDIGIKAINVTVENSKGWKAIIPLKRIKGTDKYGTWTAKISPTHDDATYSVTAVSLSNGKDTKTHSVNGRNFYVKAKPQQFNQTKEVNPQKTNTLTGLTIGNLKNMDLQSLWKELRKEPLWPTLMGFFLLTIIGSSLFLLVKMTAKRKQLSIDRK